MERFTVELTVLNRCGVLNRITALYAKCKHHIDALTVQESSAPGLAFVRIVSRGDSAVQTQMTRQLSKLFDVKSVSLLETEN